MLGLTSQVRSLENLHAKVFIFDQSDAIVGSANMSAHSIEHQLQLGLEVCNNMIVTRLVKWFDEEIWKKAARKGLVAQESHAEVIDLATNVLKNAGLEFPVEFGKLLKADQNSYGTATQIGAPSKEAGPTNDTVKFE